MPEQYVGRAEHNEFVRRIDDHNSRQDARLKEIEKSVANMTQLTVSVERLATSMETMAEEQKKQGSRLEVLEGRDGEMWRMVVGYVVTAVLGIMIGVAADMFIIVG